MGGEPLRVDSDDVGLELAPLAGTELALVDLIERMVTVSSNEATNLIVEVVGLDHLEPTHLVPHGIYTEIYPQLYSLHSSQPSSRWRRSCLGRRGSHGATGPGLVRDCLRFSCAQSCLGQKAALLPAPEPAQPRPSSARGDLGGPCGGTCQGGGGLPGPGHGALRANGRLPPGQRKVLSERVPSLPLCGIVVGARRPLQFDRSGGPGPPAAMQSCRWNH